MQKGGARQKSKYGWLKAVCVAVLVPGFGVPITKLVESHYDVSFFSPAISSLGGWILSIGTWLTQSVYIPLWTLVGITICALLMGGAFFWAVMDANSQLSTSDAKLDAANARILKLMNPPKPELSDNAHDVVMSVAGLTISKMEAYPLVLENCTELDRLQTATALDELLEHGLIVIDDSVELTPKGRVYVQLPESLSRRRLREGASLTSA
ncbi:hypothetical protein [Pseudomonas hormoni]